MTYRQTFVLALALVALSACGVIKSAKISKMSATELEQVSDWELCNPHVEETAQVMAARRERGLGDCSKDHKTCASSGYELGTELYLKCRTYLVQEKAIEKERRRQASDAMMLYGLSLMQSGQPAAPRSAPETTFYNFNGTPLTCTKVGKVVNCY